MKKYIPSKFAVPNSKFFDSFSGKPARPNRAGFTLIEVILVLVLVVVISGISLPYFSGSLKGAQLRTATRTTGRVTRYARSLAILREEMITVALDRNTMELFVGSTPKAAPAEADGELDQDVLKRLGYVDNDKEDGATDTGGLDKEVHRKLEGLTVRDFEKDWTDGDEENADLYMIRFYPNGQCEWFEMVLEDSKGMGVKIEVDPISGKMHSEFVQ